MRILLVDDHVLVREGLKGVLQREKKIMQIDEAGSAAETLELLKKQSYDLLLLDIKLQDSNGLELLSQMNSMKISVPTLMVSFYPAKLYALQAIRLGAMGYISKSAPLSEVLVAIGKIIEGKKYLPAEFMESLAFENDDHRGLLPHERLSDREREVMIYLANGLSLNDIAEKLCLSDKTVSTYRSRILQKMMMKNNVEIATYALLHRLVQ
jgi:two-component system, NarL family, invasion response regulator UvrY